MSRNRLKERGAQGAKKEAYPGNKKALSRVSIGYAVAVGRPKEVSRVQLEPMWPVDMVSLARRGNGSARGPTEPL